MKLINEPDDSFHGVIPGEANGNKDTDQQSLLTQENINEFENIVPPNDDSCMDNFLGKQDEPILIADNEEEEEKIEEKKGREEEKKEGNGGTDEDKLSDDGDDKDGDGEKKPKITWDDVRELKELQEQDLFEDIFEARRGQKLDSTMQR